LHHATIILGWPRDLLDYATALQAAHVAQLEEEYLYADEFGYDEALDFHESEFYETGSYSGGDYYADNYRPPWVGSA
jgi:hypothetical protein